LARTHAAIRATTEGEACHSNPLSDRRRWRTSVTSGHVPDPAFADSDALGLDAAHHGLLGRREEQRRLAALLHGAREGRAGVLVLRGEAGIGKSALLSDFAKNADDFCICRAGGVESEMELAYAGLQQLCGPLTGHNVELTTLHRNVLDQVFGLTEGAPPERFLVGIAALDLVATAAKKQPIVWLIDDAQWIDQASMQAIGFVGRRLLAERVVILIATRDVSDENELAGLPELRIGGLNTDDARRLFDSVVSGPTDPLVRDRIFSETRGNPLALLELPRAWTTAELVEGLSESAGIPLTGRLEFAFAKRLRELPPDTQTLLALAAAEPKGDPALLWSAAQRLGLDWSAAAPAERAGLLEVGQGVYFRHPLVRAAAYRCAPLEKRLEVHRTLAEVADPIHDADRRAWHWACSTVGHDEKIAAELERTAGRARARGGLLAAAALLERAALLTPHGERRANRMLAAARAKRDAGAFESALRLLSVVDTEPRSELRTALAEQLRGKIAFDQRRSSEAAELLLSAAQRIEPFAPGAARDMHLEALAAAVWAGGPGDRELVARAAQAARATAAAENPPRTADLLLDAIATRVTEGYAAATPALTAALDAIRDHGLGSDDADDLLWLTGNRLAGLIATEAWDYEAALALAERQVRVARESGALVQLQFALNFLANHVIVTGDLRGASALLEEERLLSTMTLVTPNRTMLIDAFRGDADRTVPLVQAMIETAIKSGHGRVIFFAHYAAAVLYNGLGRHAEALAHARQVIESDALGYQTFAAGELAEAASREGDTELLSYVSTWMQVRAAATPTEWALGMSARIRALEAGAADAEALYQESIVHFGKTPLRIELARSQLLYGEWLRRERRHLDARVELRAALRLFREFGVRAFGDRARIELEATGERIRPRAAASEAQLTPQESQVARLAAQGLTNREIAARLFIGESTVEYHLVKVFRKLDVRSRTQLARLSF
jgi:DNA-binding CsgD family transcriptional regulator